MLVSTNTEHFFILYFISKYMKNEDIVRTTENNESVEQEDKEPLG